MPVLYSTNKLKQMLTSVSEHKEEEPKVNEDKLSDEQKADIKKAAIEMATSKEEAKKFNKDLHNFNDKVIGLINIKTKINNYEINIFDTFKKLINDLNHHDDSMIKSLKSTYSGVEKLYIKAFIDMIDKSNAASAIGTLEFLDQLAKYNKVETICTENNETAVPSKVPKMKELYSSN